LEISQLTLARAMPIGFANFASHGQYRLARHLQLINKELLDIVAGRNNRLIVQMPPRHSKSETISKYFPPWYIGNFPDRRIILLSYEAEFAASWGRKARDVMSEWGESVFGVRVRQDVSAVDNWTVEKRSGNLWMPCDGGMMTSGMGGAVTGKGANVMIIDDPVKNDKEARSQTSRDNQWSWFQSTANTRIEPAGAIILMLTRWHEDDLAGRLIADMESGGQKWRILSLPAICDSNEDPLGREIGEALWPERFDEEALAWKKRSSGVWWWALFQQKPQSDEGGAFKIKWWEVWRNPPENLTKVELYVDSSFKTGVASDYSVIATWGTDGKGRYYLLDLWRDKVEFPELVTAIHAQRRKQIEQWGKNVRVVIEDRASGQSAIQTLRRPLHLPDGKVLPAIPVIAQKIEGNLSKESRADQAAIFVSAGQVFIPENASWRQAFLDEHAVFPSGLHDDMVDTTTMALLRLGDVNKIPKVSFVKEALDKEPGEVLNNSQKQVRFFGVNPASEQEYYRRSIEKGW
jgi:predicted phage terminase large subunit-like protein